jgi:tetratricopeptide (TPR) repeat protein
MMSPVTNVNDYRGLQDDVRLPVSIRAYAPGYAAASLLLTFFSLFSLYLSFNIIAGVMIALSIALVPMLAITDRFVFDGKRLIRTGVLPRLWFRMNGLRGWMKLRNIEQVDTITVGSFRRGGRVRFMHRTSVFGNGPPIIFSGAGKKYRRMIRALLPKLEPHLLDCRSLDLRKFLVEPYQVTRSAAELKIPSADVLEGMIRDRPSRTGNVATDSHNDPSVSAEQLALTANQLRISGSLIRAMEAFRRALRIEPRDPWLLFDYSRCLFSLSYVDKDARLGRRGAAALRLAERRAAGDAELLERIGETYRQFGYSQRAANAYQAALERLGECFRALIGQAELALDQGKLAHVVHNFSAANMATRNAALKRWTRSEADYFSRLNDDENYMELEVSRMNLLDKLARWRGSAFRIALYSIPLIAAGVIFEEPLVTDAGWLVSAICLVGWAVMSIASKMLSPRIPYELVEEDR